MINLMKTFNTIHICFPYDYEKSSTYGNILKGVVKPKSSGAGGRVFSPEGEADWKSPLFIKYFNAESKRNGA